MPGGFISGRSRRYTPKGFYDPHPHRSNVRITNVYATPWRLPEEADAAPRVPTDYLRLGRIERFYQTAHDQLPTVVHSETVNPARMVFKRWKKRHRLTAARLWIFQTPSRQLVAALTFDPSVRLLGAIDLLEDCYYLDLRTEHGTLGEHLRRILSGYSLPELPNTELLPERHQIAYGPALAERNCEDIVQRIIYRKDLPYRPEFSAISYPAELNRRPGNTVAVGPYVSAICGHQNDVENCALLSAVQAVASAARLREIRQSAYQALESFRHLHQPAMTIKKRRRTLESLNDQLTDLELELSHSVEAAADIGLLIPSLRVESYHLALFEAMDLSHRSGIASRMLQRLDRAINAGLTTVQSVERRQDDDRRLRWAVAVGFVSTVAIPLTLVLAFFGINTTEVVPGRSMFDGVYLGVYVVIALILLAGALPPIVLYLQHRRRSNGGSV